MAAWKIWTLFLQFTANVWFSSANYAVLTASNLALNKPTFQSSGTNSKLAANGNYEDFFEIGTGGYKWWNVDLEKFAKVKMIRVYAPKDCCYGRLADVTIWRSAFSRPQNPLSSSRRWINEHFHKGRVKHAVVKTFQNLVTARQVAVTTNGKPLSISEVEVFESLPTTNIAIGKPAYQSSSGYFSEVPKLLNNGIYDECSLIESSSYRKFWIVDLQRLYSACCVRIHHGKDCNALRTHVDFYTTKTKLHQFTDRYWGPSHGTYLLETIVTFEDLPEPWRQGKVESRQYDTLKLAEVEVFLHLNPGLNKPTSQSSTYESYHSSLAVNGYNDDFTHTEDTGDKWWQVDLLEILTIKSVFIRNRNEFRERLHDFTVEMGKVNGEFKEAVYVEPAIAEGMDLKFHKKIEMRYLNITSYSASDPLSLAEVEFTEADFAEDGIASSSSLFDLSEMHRAANAIDNNDETFAMTEVYGINEQWWTVHIPLMRMTSTKVYFDEGWCRRHNFEDYYSCTHISGRIQIKTSNIPKPPAVSLHDNINWKVCYNQSTVPDVNHIHVECNRNYRQPIMQHLGIQPLFHQELIRLKKVEIFGKKLPTFKHGETVNISTGANHISLTFRPWNLHDDGGLPPTLYVVELSNPQGFKVAQNKTHARVVSISATWNSLLSDTEYYYKITCYFEEFPCHGNSTNGRVKTQRDPTTVTIKPEHVTVTSPLVTTQTNSTSVNTTTTTTPVVTTTTSTPVNTTVTTAPVNTTATTAPVATTNKATPVNTATTTTPVNTTTTTTPVNTTTSTTPAVATTTTTSVNTTTTTAPATIATVDKFLTPTTATLQESTRANQTSVSGTVAGTFAILIKLGTSVTNSTARVLGENSTKSATGTSGNNSIANITTHTFQNPTSNTIETDQNTSTTAVHTIAETPGKITMVNSTANTVNAETMTISPRFNTERTKARDTFSTTDLESSTSTTLKKIAVLTATNLAIHKPTSQNGGRNSHLAVNGNYEDFSETDLSSSNWWNVDLETPVEIKMIRAFAPKDCCYGRLASVAIFTALEKGQWNEALLHKENAENVIVVIFTPSRRARYVAVSTNTQGKPLSLSEVEVFGNSNLYENI